MRYCICHLLVMTIWSAVICLLSNVWPISVVLTIPLFAGAYIAYVIAPKPWGAFAGAVCAVVSAVFLLPFFVTFLSMFGLFGLGPTHQPTDLNGNALHLCLIVYSTVVSVVSGYMAGIYVVGRSRSIDHDCR